MKTKDNIIKEFYTKDCICGELACGWSFNPQTGKVELGKITLKYWLKK